MGRKSRRTKVKNNTPEKNDGPTPQTAAHVKRHQCPIQTMARARRRDPKGKAGIGPEQEAAFNEINMVKYKSLNGSLPHASKMDREFRGEVSVIEPLEFIDAYARYGEWRKVMLARKDGPVIIDILHEVFMGKSMRQLDALYGKRKGFAGELIKEGLAEYARLAGWLH